MRPRNVLGPESSFSISPLCPLSNYLSRIYRHSDTSFMDSEILSPAFLSDPPASKKTTRSTASENEPFDTLFNEPTHTYIFFVAFYDDAGRAKKCHRRAKGKEKERLFSHLTSESFITRSHAHKTRPLQKLRDFTAE